jgi:hypothetical protein
MFRFDVAISYAGEEEGIAKDLSRLLQDKGAKVFFAKNEKVYLFGKSLTLELDYIFGPYTKFAIPIVSKHYIQKYWTKYEFNVSKMEQRKRGFEFILPVRLDDITLEGLNRDIVYIDLRKEGFLGTAEIIIRKLRDIYPIKEVTVPKVWVATFGLIIEDILENYEFSLSVPREYPHLCDWFEKDLMDRLSKTSMEALKLLEDSRDGETLSVRVKFKLDPDKQPFDFGNIGWWELLELDDFNEIYPE